MLCALLYRELDDGVVLRGWQASQFWISYGPGFARRGLPGEVLALLAGGPPSSAFVTVAGVALSLAGVACWALITRWTVDRAGSDTGRLLVACILVASPFTFTQIAMDLGRYDALGVVAAAVMLAAVPRLGVTGGTCLVATVLVVAVGAEEFQLAFLAPLAVVVLRRAGCPWLPAAFAVLPAAGLALASVSVVPSAAQTAAYSQAAHAARPDIPADGSSSAILALRQTFSGAVVNLGEMRPWTFPALAVAFGAVLVVTAWLAWRSLSRPSLRLFWALTSFYMTAAVALSVAGIDYRRWWSMAFLATVCTAVTLADRSRTEVPALPGRRAVTAVLLLSVAAAALLPRSAGEVDHGAQNTLELVTTG